MLLRERETSTMNTKSAVRSCILAVLAVASVGAYAQMRTTGLAEAQNAEHVVDAEGNLRVPEDYRTAYQLLGIWAVGDDKGKGSKEIHIVFASSGTVAAY